MTGPQLPPGNKSKPQKTERRFKNLWLKLFWPFYKDKDKKDPPTPCSLK
ncbi:hypothetical protein X474_06450 [Dethiosulfatarculus sandiegensis]|uniref:Uncharacterized protein n=1 Tax=Dethiosulfatarculus sandiegensis TaxID=1429043 RepID=A0A0D2J9F6_9BACT|nr:hypothetical protein X474_06450 [Dethiosulfatarculus sandiegensis]